MNPDDISEVDLDRLLEDLDLRPCRGARQIIREWLSSLVTKPETP
jgi:hypothetical protein